MSELPKAVWSGTFSLFGVGLRCHVLDNGQRIIEADSMAELLEAMGAPGVTLDHSEVEAFARWRQGNPDAR